MVKTSLTAVLAGVCLAGSVPPWGWWPLAFIGFALIDRLIAVKSRRRRFTRMWLVCAVWLATAMLWMWDLTPPGYVIACVLYAAYYGVAAMLVPPSGWARRLILPGVFAGAEAIRWYWPFGGVPLANVALSQVDTPLGQTARLGGPLLVVVLVVAVGGAFAGFLQRDSAGRQSAIVAVAVVAMAVAGAWLHPRATVERDIEVGLVQGGGPTRTRASAAQEPVVLARHIEATRALSGLDLDLILWPENVVNPGANLSYDEARRRVVAVAATYDTPVSAGWFHPTPDNSANVNYQNVIVGTGEELDRYDKVRIVPFGEYVPLRGVIEASGLGAGIPRRDTRPGTAEPVLDTPVGPVGVSISWEAYFERRSRDAVNHGAQILANPTNGSSYWLTQVHTQQVASNSLRAIENDRWVLMVGPTGLSAIIDPDGVVTQRTGIGERRVLVGTVEMRSGRTLAAHVGPWPVLAYATATAMAGLLLTRSRRTP